MATRPSDSELEVGEAVQHEGHETLLPSVERSMLSTRRRIRTELDAPATRSATGSAPTIADPADGGGERTRVPHTGEVVGGRYEVQGQLGSGGMGRVLRVRHSALGKPFALKLIKSSISTHPHIRELFYREARLASALTHDNTCSIVDFGQDASFGLFMVMELLEGQTVHARLRHSGRFAPKVACDVMWQVSDAARFIHSRQIVHGDIKTENMFMVRTPANRRLIKLLDFGLSRADLDHSEGLEGTPEYLAPERIDGGAASQASDIYALGIVFFEMLTARLPFTGDIEQIFGQHRSSPMPLASQFIDGDPLDERAEQIIARATAKDPSARHPDVAAFMYELRALMGMLGMEQARRRPSAPDAMRERRDYDHRLKAAAEVFGAVPLPMASCDAAGRVRAANPAFLEFLGVGGTAGGLELRDSALPEVYPTLFEDLEAVAADRRPIKRVLYLNEGGDRVVEAAVVLSAAPAGAEVTAGEVHIVLHPLRALLS